MMSGMFSPTHLILVLVIVLIIFGPGKLPDVGKLDPRNGSSPPLRMPTAGSVPALQLGKL